MNDKHTLSHTTWNCKYHVMWAPKYRRKVFWCRGYYVDTVGKNAKKMQEYIQKQLKEDQLNGQLTLEEESPFTGSK